MKFFKKIKYFPNWIRWVVFGFCPECNSSAPKMYDCNVCDWEKHHYQKDKIKRGNWCDKDYWWNRFNQKHFPKLASNCKNVVGCNLWSNDNCFPESCTDYKKGKIK